MSATTTAAPAPSRLQSLAGRLTQLARKPTGLIVSVDAISPNPHQPRKTFDEEFLRELAESIRTTGLIEPLVLRALGPDSYQLLAGEQRWRAAKIAGVTELPAVLREVSDDLDALAIALIENLARQDMVPADEIAGVADLALRIGVQATATKIGKTPQWVSKRKRIAQAPEWIRVFVAEGATADVEALYELAKLADDDEPRAREIISSHGKGSHLRALIKTAAKAAASSAAEAAPAARPLADPEDTPDDAGEPDSSLSSPSRGQTEELPISHAKPSRPTDALAPDRADASPLTVHGAQRRGKLITLLTSGGDLVLDLTQDARAELIALLTLA